MLYGLREAGFKRAGMISMKKNLIEVMSTEQLSAPLKDTSDKYCRILTEECNKLMMKTTQSLERLKSFILYIKQ